MWRTALFFSQTGRIASLSRWTARISALWSTAAAPRRGFQERFQAGPTLGLALRRLLVLRVPVAFLGLVASYAGFRGSYARLIDAGSPVWRRLLETLPDAVDPQALREALGRFPPPPSMGSALPWLALLAPLAVLSLWLHDATFDHAGLWLLGGLRARRGFRASLVADAEALQVGVLGAAAGLVGDLPWLGARVSAGVALALIPVAVYFWLIRGHALAAWHDCPVWKGVTATILNMVLALAMVLVLLAACAVMVLLLV